MIYNHEYEKFSKEKQWIADFVKERNKEIANMKKFPKPKKDQPELA
jgi:hypothetical protein